MAGRPDGASIVPAAPDLTAFFKALGDETRLAIVRRLARTDLTAGEIVAGLRLPQNAVSYHLRQLRDAGLVRGRLSSLDGRDVYYTLDLARLATLYRAAGTALHPALVRGADVAQAGRPRVRLLFLCTHNSARSQLAEALARLVGGPETEAASAGRDPRSVHPLTIRLLEEWGVDPTRHASKSVDLFLRQPFDHVITVCDRMRENCPTLPGAAARAHWSLPDPTTIADPEEQWRAFRAIAAELRTRIAYLLATVRLSPREECA